MMEIGRRKATVMALCDLISVPAIYQDTAFVGSLINVAAGVIQDEGSLARSPATSGRLSNTQLIAIARNRCSILDCVFLPPS